MQHRLLLREDGLGLGDFGIEYLDLLLGYPNGRDIT